MRREGQAVQIRAEEGVALSAEHGFSYWLSRSSILRGWALSEEDQAEKGIVQIREGLEVSRATGTELDHSYELSLLAEGCGKNQRVGEALALLAEAIDGMLRTGDCYHEAELYRIKGELLLQKAANEAKGRTEHR